jgi:hypothetical protein
MFSFSRFKIKEIMRAAAIGVRKFKDIDKNYVLGREQRKSRGYIEV